ncbi:ABC transporter ATP-binding protein [Sodalis sp. dw_96]|uniref:dipeptide ABC transporter ATP-binding protein n=1 Tax=Sodalis sp. dw_96 TaxID=2719794 RepID=UPI001BD5B7E4|nr:ABC transporter ATP-binding protein [Sodalis sp. dw_96]
MTLTSQQPADTSAAPDASVEALPTVPLRIHDLYIDYRTRGGVFTAVRGVSFEVNPGEVVALVGESGSGKSTIALSALGMLPESAAITRGSVVIAGHQLEKLGEKASNRFRGRDAGWIPQDPMMALNPLHRIGRQVAEPLIIHRLFDKRTIGAKVASLLGRVHISNAPVRARQFPHELSGGMRQRVLIAAAIGPEPKLIVADEPTTALDVTVQKAILDDIDALVTSTGMAMLLITHDLGVAADRADRIIVLKEGKIVEQGPTRQILTRPEHDYTRQLLANAPGLATRRRPAPPRLEEAPADGGPLLSIRHVSHTFPATNGAAEEESVRAVIDVSLDVPRGKTLAVVGESGSGKSTSARIALGLIAPDSGSVLFEGIEIHRLDQPGLRRMRRLVQPIYQNPFSSFDPRFTVADLIGEPLIGFGLGDKTRRLRRIRELTEQVSLPQNLLGRYPAELSGGQLQRVAIARALAPEPALLICDEPVSALDVTIQAQILDLLAGLQETHGLSYLFITHDLAVVRQMADQVAVMKGGRIVETGHIDAIFTHPQHDYTRLLLASIPGQAARNA